MLLSKKTYNKRLIEAQRQGFREGLDKNVDPNEPSRYATMQATLNVPQDYSLIEAIREAESKAFSDSPNLKDRLVALAESVVIATKALVDGVSFDTAKLHMIQKQIARMYREDPLIRSVGNLTVHSVIGSGIKFAIGNVEVDEYLKWYWSPEGVNMEERQKEITLHRYLLGEYFLAHHITPGTLDFGGKKVPDILARRFYPWDVDALITRDDDVEEIHGIRYKSSSLVQPQVEVKNYKTAQLYLNPNRYKRVEGDFEENTYVQYIRFNDGFDIRGYPQVLPLLRWATIIREIMYDSASKFHEWSKVLYLLTVQQREKDWAVDVERRAPKGGTVIVNTPNAKWDILDSKLDARGLDSIWLHSLYYFSAGAGYPYQYIVHDYSNNNLASSREARVPLVMTIRNMQDCLQPEFVTILRVALKAGVDAKVIPARIKVPILHSGTDSTLPRKIESLLHSGLSFVDKIEAVAAVLRKAADMVEIDTLTAPIQLLFPQISAMSEKEQAEVVKIYQELGLDQQSVFETLNMDWATIQARKIAQADFDIQLARRRAQLTSQDPFNMPDPDNPPEE